ncbi:MAG TPA: BTAD domain-containing putative transcriptional regulator [Streptosporangiaceae bacterium]
MDFGILGPVEAVSAGRPVALGQPGVRLVLGLLLLEPNAVIPAERLIGMMWGDDPPATARASLQNRVAALRTRLRGGTALVRTRAPGYLVEVEPLRIDAHAFTAQVGQARQTADPAARAEILDGALRLWRGPLLADVIDDALRWRLEATLAETRLSAIELHAEAELDRGQHELLLNRLKQEVVEHPARERLVACLMIALARAGRLGEALQSYRDHRSRLDQDLGIAPGRALEALHEHLLRDDPATAVYHQPEPGRPLNCRSAGRSQVIPRELPAPTGDFVGRDAELGLLASLLTGRPDGLAPAAVAVTGPGGIGKTTLAIEVAAAVASRFPDGQLYADLQGSSDEWLRPATVLARFLRALGVADQVIPAGPTARAALFRDVTAGRRLLVVLDDALDERQVRDLMPGTASCAVLITARRRLTALAGLAVVDLGTLSPAASVRLLAAAGAGALVAADPQAAASIAELCGQLPLALRIVGAQIAARPHRDLRETAGRLIDERARLDELAVADLDVRGSISISCRGLSTADRAVFRRLGLAEFRDFPAWVALALAGTEPGEIDPALDRLVAARLVDFAGTGQDGRPRFRLHDLVRIYARELAEAEEPRGEPDLAFARLLDAFLSLGVISRDLYFETPATVSVPVRHPPASPPCAARMDAMIACLDAESSNVLVVISQAMARGCCSAAWQLAYLLFGFFDSGRHIDDALTAVRLALRAANLTGDAMAQRIMYGHHAAICRRGHLVEQALDSQQHVIELARQAGHRVAEGRAYVGVSSTLGRLGRYDEAFAAFTAADEILLAAGDDFARATMLSNHSALCAERGQLDLARRHGAEAVKLARAARNPDALARASANLAACTITTDRPGARRLLDEARQEAQRLGSIDIEVEVCCISARLALQGGASDDAFALLASARTLCVDSGNAGLEAAVLGCLGLVHLAAGSEAAARRCLAEADGVRGLPAASRPAPGQAGTAAGQPERAGWLASQGQTIEAALFRLAGWVRLGG